MTRMNHERLLHCDYELLAAQPGGPGGVSGYIQVYIYIYMYNYIKYTISVQGPVPTFQNCLKRSVLPFCEAHSAARATKTQANSPSRPCCPGHSASLPTVLPRPQCWHAHSAVQATVLHCPQCAPGHENSSKLSFEPALPGPQCCNAHNAAGQQCCQASRVARATVLHCPQCCPGHENSSNLFCEATSEHVPLGHGPSCTIGVLAEVDRIR